MSIQTLTSDAQALVDAVLLDLESEVVFPSAYRIHRYREPPLVTPELCPLLAVYLNPDGGDAPYLAASAGCYEHTWRLVVAWWVASGASEENGTGNELLAMGSLATAQALMDRIKAWPLLAIPGISTRYGQLDGAVDYPSQSFCWGVTIPIVVNPQGG